MSTKGTVESITKSKSGKSWRVKIGSEFYGANFDSKIDSMLGKPVDFEWEDGKFGRWLQSWGPDTSPQPVTAPAPTVTKQSSGDRWWLNFVSNAVAHSIAAGHVKTIQELRVWAVGARDAIEKADGQDLPY